MALKAALVVGGVALKMLWIIGTLSPVHKISILPTRTRGLDSWIML